MRVARQGRGLGVWVLAAGVAAGMAQQAPAPAAGAPDASSSCRLVKDASGNLVLDPACPPTVLPANPQAPAQSGASGTPSAPASQRFPYPGNDGGQTAAPVPASPIPAAPGANPAAANEPASKRFPYPGESDGGGAPGAGASSSPSGASDSSGSSSSSASDSNAGSASSGVPPTSTAKPVPGQPPLNDAGSSGSSSSSSDSDAAGDAGAGDAADAGTTPHRRGSRRKLPPIEEESPADREAEDVQVAGFYQNDGDFKGAYDRAKDAVSLDKDDPAAHLALAESARRLGKLDEAEAEYKRCLALDPVPKVRKVAERAMKEMTGGG